MPSLALSDEVTLSKRQRPGRWCRVTSMAGPPVALTLAVPPPATVTLPALLSRNAAVRARGRQVRSARPSPNVVVPVVLLIDDAAA